MAKKERQYVFRLDAELAARVDAYLARLREETGVEIPQSAVIRRLIELGLERVGEAKPPKRAKG